ncbi:MULTISPECIES: hypothetical protein [unclassified Lysinibacillus]|uniref:hypothetical protein n=1 Tax=unclassified Lysinibacillus TaxID=2636778 RepID=UPI00087F4581|nr:MULTISPECIES: hypothetical protein [unclassified Lysinibacillus]SCY99023.1 hypothetical protein SAMN02787078_03440 [Lysinibacillus sp. SG9]SDB47120.1 hypothetical protein SAMN02787079_03623 [Lysinibacillus sp. TC-37]SFT12302.1 hypothetical protein SAMN02787087_03742 [Lysinibacillus sp. SG55]
MSQYKVISRFQENNHAGHVYEVGDTYPANGKKLVKTRAETLTEIHREYGVAFLKAVEEPKKAPTKQASKQPSTDEKSDA